MHDQPSPENILQTGMAFWASKTLLSAIEMGVFTELTRGAEPFEALRGRLGLHPRSARDFLDALVALGFLQRNGDRYANTPETDLFLDRKKPSYLGGFLEMAKGPSGNKCAISGRRGACPARREERAYRVYVSDEQRSPAGCIGVQNRAVIPGRALTIACIHSGATSPRRFAPERPRTRARAAGPGSSKCSTRSLRA